MLRFLISKSHFSNLKERLRMDRMTRLKTDNLTCFPTETFDKQIRNIGIIAHIDAGKTTTTERMLYYAGALPNPGEVHDGNTVMDYMPQERERGITIRSAAITFNWNNYQFNLIDTPGHIDFTAEVETSLRVLDGAIAILDGVSGVETQSETVWMQANKFNVPRIVFVNKLDRAGGSLDYTLDSMKDRLNINPLLLQLPIGEEEDFKGIIDLIEMQSIYWLDKYGNEVEITDIEDNLLVKAKKQREELLENIALMDDQFADKYLEGDISADYIRQTIRKIITAKPLETFPILVGSALKNKGVQPLMDSVIHYLPAPSECLPIKDIETGQTRRLEKDEQLTAYMYKMIYDLKLGKLGYTRIYSGKLQSRQKLYNSSQKESEKIGNIYRVRANRYVPIKEAHAGDIIAIEGLKKSYSGSTLLNDGDLSEFKLSNIQLPECVIYSSLEYESLKDKNKLQEALQILEKEDVSLKVQEDEAGLITIGGLGELHLEIVVQRLKEEWNLNTKLRKMQVEYQEGISQSAQKNYIYNDKALWFELTLKIEPIDIDQNEVVFDFKRGNLFDSTYQQYKETEKYVKNPCRQVQVETLEDELGEDAIFNLESLRFELFKSVEDSINVSLQQGMLMSLGLRGVRVSILGGKYIIRRTNELAIGRCVNNLMKELIEEAQPTILEPMMNINISCQSDLTSTIVNDLVSNRRGKIDEILTDNSKFGQKESKKSLIIGGIPLQETIGYSTYLRSLSQGEANFIMKFRKYESVGAIKQKEILQEY